MEVERKNCERSSSPTTCEDWKNGNCSKGEECPNLHWWLTTNNNFHHDKRDHSSFKRLVCWIPPPKGFVKINCDGAYTWDGKKAAAGGVIRDSQGEFIFAFSSVLRVDSAAEAELFAIKLGMEIGISMGYKNLIVESDSLTAIQLINRRLIHQRHPFYALVSSITQMGANTDYITWNHAFRETNSVADGLAKYGLSLPSKSPVILFKFSPNFLLLPLCADKIGTMYYC